MRERPRIAVIGAGAIGSLVAGRLAIAGLDVTLLARGERFARLRADGLTIRTPEEAVHVPIDVVEALPESSFDILISAVKAWSLPQLAPVLAAAAKPGAPLLPLVNGMPWWYFQDGMPVCATVGAVDPEGMLASTFPAARIVGSVVYARAALDERGDVVSQGKERFLLGAVCAGGAAVVDRLAAVMRHGGFPVEISHAIRREVWTKLALNLSTNPLSVVSGSSLEEMARDPALRAVVAAILAETLELAGKLGYQPEPDVEQLLRVCAAAGPFMTSMAQDFAKGLPLELGAIADATFEAAERCGHAMPAARAVAALAWHRALRKEPKRLRDS
ncbi:MAG TPA: 2-dehydropantoate 2-reductase [Sphingomonas sp.]